MTSNSLPKKDTIEQLCRDIGIVNPLWIANVKMIVEEYIKRKRKTLFIETVSTMDCELSGIREETFDELLKGL